MNSNKRWLVAWLLTLSLGVSAAWAQDVAGLDKTFKKVAESATPRTVLVKSYVGDGDRSGFGTGAIVSKDGWILTCAHVIDIASRVEVVLSDKTVLKAKVVGKNREQDYALLKVEAENDLPYFELGESSKLEVGQWVVALGHPGGPYADLQPAFAAGRVTRLHCKLPVQFLERFYNDAIQTDCPIYAGNSGGPLVDLQGRLLGLNGAILMINDNAYAVPIEQVMANYERMQKGEVIEGERAGPEAFAEMQKFIRPEDMQKMQQRMMQNFGKLFGGKDNPLKDLMGKDGPLKDLFGEDNPLKDLFGEGGQGMDLSKLFEQFGKMFGGDGKGEDNPFKDLFGGKGGEGLDLEKMFREFGKMFGEKDGQGMDLGKMFEEFGKMFGGEPQPGPDRSPRGTPDREADPDAEPAPKPRSLPDAQRGYLGMVPASDSDQQELGGVLVGQVVAGSPAEKADLRKGDVLVNVNGQPTPDVWTLRQALADKAVGARLELEIIRARLLDTSWVRERQKITVTLGKRR